MPISSEILRGEPSLTQKEIGGKAASLFDQCKTALDTLPENGDGLVPDKSKSTTYRTIQFSRGPREYTIGIINQDDMAYISGVFQSNTDGRMQTREEFAIQSVKDPRESGRMSYFLYFDNRENKEQIKNKQSAEKKIQGILAKLTKDIDQNNQELKKTEQPPEGITIFKRLKTLGRKFF